jgi:hypothetical protein
LKRAKARAPLANEFAAFAAAFAKNRPALLFLENKCWTIIYLPRSFKFMKLDRPQKLRPNTC